MLVLLLFIVLKLITKEEKKVFTICTEESLSYVVQDMLEFFIDTREPSVDFRSHIFLRMRHREPVFVNVFGRN